MAVAKVCIFCSQYLKTRRNASFIFPLHIIEVIRESMAALSRQDCAVPVEKKIRVATLHRLNANQTDWQVGCGKILSMIGEEEIENALIRM